MYHFVDYIQLAVLVAAADASPTAQLNPTWSKDLGKRTYSTTTYCYYDANGRKTCETKKGMLGTEGYSTTPAPVQSVRGSQGQGENQLVRE